MHCLRLRILTLRTAREDRSVEGSRRVALPSGRGACQVEDDFTMLQTSSAPFQVEDDPVLRFFGMAYDKKTALDSDSSGEEDQLIGGAGFI
mmetsp:Transcript_1788/g.6391  ORF Transcript_1788/g.6391 Transcript_1788/m.6391 type:complete len:91 (+) Transcript_1788:574-846(+)